MLSLFEILSPLILFFSGEQNPHKTCPRESEELTFVETGAGTEISGKNLKVQTKCYN
ncbi:MAG: hypothetical protein OXJ52_03430 [Oligoflexia bacterium]|nr:hypothetical protein [Oligoflexia bacterium]